MADLDAPLSSLARLTLRQLRAIASQLGISLGARQRKQALVQEISQHPRMKPSSAVSEAAEPQGSASVQNNSAPAPWTSATVAVPEGPAPQPSSAPSGSSSSRDNDRVVFLPRDPEWGYVFWEISPETRKAAEAAGAQQLCLRVSDVTGMDDGAAHPHTLQEVPVDANSADWHVPMPLSNRDYRVELGFRLEDAGWLSVAFSAKARVPAARPSEQLSLIHIPSPRDRQKSRMPSSA